MAAIKGPTSFALYTGQTLLDYNGDGECSTSSNHAPLLVGYGTDPKFEVYWLVKNSWSDTWGEGGFARQFV